MDLSEHKYKIEQEFGSYEDLQARHLIMIQKEDIELPMIKALTDERKNASARLQSTLNRFMENAGQLATEDSLTLLSKYESRLNSIMVLDERIAAEIEIHKDLIKKQLIQMKQGKHAMQGYKSAAKPISSPRVFSLSR